MELVVIVVGVECSQYWTGQLRRCDAFDLVIKPGRVLCALVPQPFQINACGGS